MEAASLTGSVVGAVLLGLLLSAACLQPARPPAAIDRPFVLTSITVLADLIRQVGGERVEVRALVPVGADPNTFQPPPRHVLDVARADLVVLNGLGLDRTVRTVVANAARAEVPVWTLSDGMPTLESGLAIGDMAGRRGNPYLWLNPRHAITYVEKVRDALSAVDRVNSGVYAANAAGYVDRIRALDAEIEAELRAIPAGRRKLVTLHDGFPYFAERYGFELLAAAIKTPGRAPTAQEVADVARVLRQHDVPAVFTEPQLDARLLKLAARDAGIKIATLYSDTLDQHVPSYEALLRYNARQLVNGLQ
jgi:ABC-type Zn uptake system ZnuABC Zn-binding protein ZnuA